MVNIDFRNNIFMLSQFAPRLKKGRASFGIFRSQGSHTFRPNLLLVIFLALTGGERDSSEFGSEIIILRYSRIGVQNIIVCSL